MNKQLFVALAVFSCISCASAMAMEDVKKEEVGKSALQRLKERTEQNPGLLKAIKEDFAKRSLPKGKAIELWDIRTSPNAIRKFFKEESLDPMRVVIEDVPLLARLCHHHDEGVLVGNFIAPIGYLLDQGADPNEKLIMEMDGGACAFASILELLAISTNASKEKKCKVAELLLSRGAKITDPIVISLAREEAKNEGLAQLYVDAYEVPIKALSSLMKNNERHKDCLVTCVNS